MLTLNELQHQQIKALIRQYSGLIPVQAVEEYLTALDATIDQFIVALLPIARELTLAPISGFSVGAVALGETGNIYVGANQELSKLALCHSVHAEQSVMAIAHQHGERAIEKVAISANPCGHCRQFLFEQREGGKLKIYVNDLPPATLNQLLPFAFGPQDLKGEGGLLTPQRHALVLSPMLNDELMLLALHAAERSYAPYSHCYAGAALRTRDGRTFAGSYLENAVFNPSLAAMQSALVSLVISGCDYREVTHAAFIQAKNNIIDQASSAKMIMAAVCPEALLQTSEAIDKSL